MVIACNTNVHCDFAAGAFPYNNNILPLWIITDETLLIFVSILHLQSAKLHALPCLLFLSLFSPDGIIALRRAATEINPGSLYHLYVQCSYALTMTNGTNTAGFLQGFFYMHVLGMLYYKTASYALLYHNYVQ